MSLRPDPRPAAALLLVSCTVGAAPPAPATAPWSPPALAIDGAPPVPLAAVPIGLWVATTELTNAQVRALDPAHTSNRAQRPHYQAAGLDLDGDAQPAVLTWREATALAAQLSAASGLTVRLPTAAEWRALAHAGTTGAWTWGDDPAQARAHANLAGPATFALLVKGDPAYPQDDLAAEDDGHVGTAPVASFAPNAWGLYDVHGNLSEWTTTPGPEDAPGSRLHLGGSWTHGPALSRIDSDNYCFEDQHYDVLGVRLVVEPPDPSAPPGP